MGGLKNTLSLESNAELQRLQNWRRAQAGLGAVFSDAAGNQGRVAAADVPKLEVALGRIEAAMLELVLAYPVATP